MAKQTSTGRRPKRELHLTELASRLKDLKADFQNIANAHPWVCLGSRTPTGNYAHPVAGEACGPQALQEIKVPRDPARRAVTDSVNDLTFRADRLLLEIVANCSGIPGDIAQEILEHRPQHDGFGWIRWLRYATLTHLIQLVENYPQVAVTALRGLIDLCRDSQFNAAESLSERERRSRKRKLEESPDPNNRAKANLYAIVQETRRNCGSRRQTQKQLSMNKDFLDLARQVNVATVTKADWKNLFDAVRRHFERRFVNEHKNVAIN